jgi:iron complex outermembrane receptor protein
MSSSFVSFRRHPLALACAGLALVGSFGAAAQDSAPTPTGLDTITVTAEHREQNLQEVPVSVGVVQGERMRDFTAGGDDTLLALSGRVPSLYAETTTGRIFPRFYIRGLGNIDFYLGASQPVSIIQDDVVLEHVVLKSNPVYDVDQVEVLRGPQGSLFGRNTTAGIVKFDTAEADPGLHRPRQRQLRDLQQRVDRRRLRRPDQRHRLVPRVGPVPAPRRLRRQHLQGPSADGTVSPKKNAMGGFDDRNVRAAAADPERPVLDPGLGPCP